jgi:lipid A 3-O-deacylase
MKWRAFELLGMWAARATVLILTYSCCTISPLAQESGHRVSYESRDSERQSIWIDEVGSGFRAGTFEAGMSLGGGIGHKVLLSETEHDLALAAFDFGWVFSEVMAKDHWYRGNWEVLGEVFQGAQFSPNISYVIGASALLRYNFCTHSRWVPFVDGGGGAAATSIRNTDLSTTFEYNLQAGVGTHYMVRENLALTAQYRFLHLSNAGLQAPNLGVNTSMFYIGASWFFGPRH